MAKGIALAVVAGALALGCTERLHGTADIMGVDGVVDVGGGAEVSPAAPHEMLQAGDGSDPVAPGTLYVASQGNWRWCHKCQGLFFAGNPNPVCPAGGAHENAGSADYYLAYDMLPVAGWQNGWRWCRKCQGLFFGDNPNPVCPAGGAHENVGSADYSLIYGTGGSSDLQEHWRWCGKCQGLFFGDNPNPVCPAGGAHTSAGSGNYILYHR